MKRFWFILTTSLMTILYSCQSGSNSSDNEVKAHLDEGHYKAAADLILSKPAAELDKNQVLKTAQYFSEKVDFDKSDQLLKKILEAKPDDVAGRLLYANNLREQKEFNAAIIIYDEMANIDSIRFVVLPERARLYILINEFNKATSDIEEAKGLQPKYFAPFLADGLLQYSQGRTEEALDLFEIAENLDPGVSAEASLYAGYILLRSNLNYDAMGKFTKAIEVGKYINKGYAFINRGVCQINLQDTAFACHDWDSGYYYLPEQAKTYLDMYCK